MRNMLNSKIVETSTSINRLSPKIDRSSIDITDLTHPVSCSRCFSSCRYCCASPSLVPHVWIIGEFALIAFHPLIPTCTPGFHIPESTVYCVSTATWLPTATRLSFLLPSFSTYFRFILSFLRSIPFWSSQKIDLDILCSNLENSQ